MKKITLIGTSNGATNQGVDSYGNVTVDVPVKIIEVSERDGQRSESFDWVRVTATGKAAERLAAIPAQQNIFVEGLARFDELPSSDGGNDHYIGVTAFRAFAVGQSEEHYINFVGRGNLGREPEMSYTPSGTALTKFSLAVNHRQDDVLWADIVCWNRLADSTNSHLSKGRSVLVDGRPRVNRWTGNDGVRRARFEVTANDVEFLPSGSTGGGNPGGGPTPGAASGGMNPGAPTATAAASAPASNPAPASAQGPQDEQPW